MLKYVKVMNEEDLPPGKSAIIAAGKEDVGDTSTLADVVREAGLSLERALARRDARDDSEPPG